MPAATAPCDAARPVPCLTVRTGRALFSALPARRPSSGLPPARGELRRPWALSPRAAIPRRPRGLFAALALLLLLAACAAPAPDAMAPSAPGQAGPPRARPEAPAATPPSAESQALARYYRLVQDDMLSRGLMRMDGGGPDTPFDARMLAQNFLDIALFDEYETLPSGLKVARKTPAVLRRWPGPIRMSIVFGPSVPPDRREADRTMIAGYATRLSLLTRVPIGITDHNPNFHVLILNEDERRAFAPQLAQMVPGIGAADLAAITDLDRSTFCFAYAFSRGGAPSYAQAIALIRAEHPDLLRRSCVHEELAQAMGLVNDSPTARPSIFNDDEEFALLTRQDELMLRILYDPRLRPGMTEAEARPIVEAIAVELLGGEV